MDAKDDSISSTPLDFSFDADVSGFETDLQSARDNLTTISDYLNVLVLAYESAATIPPEKFASLCTTIHSELVCALTFYRLASRSLAVRSRNTQESYQSATNYASAELAKLERLYAELENTKAAVQKLVPPDYAMFRDLNMISKEELEKTNPALFDEALSQSEVQHMVLLAQLQHESGRRKGVLKEIEELEREKRTLQETLKRKRENMVTTNLEVDKCLEILRQLAHKFNISPEDFNQDFSDLETPVLEAFLALRRTEESVSSPTKDVEMVEAEAVPVREESPLSPEEPALQIVTDEVEISREEGEASDEAEENMAT